MFSYFFFNQNLFIFFLLLYQKIYCWYSLEAPIWSNNMCFCEEVSGPMFFKSLGFTKRLNIIEDMLFSAYLLSWTNFKLPYSI